MEGDLAAEIRRLSQAIDGLGTMSHAGGQFAGSVPASSFGSAGGIGPGRGGGGAGGVRASSVAGTVVAGLRAGVEPVVSAGLVNASRGGSYFGGAATEYNKMLNKLASGLFPGAGELLGFAPTERIQSGTQSDLNGLTNQVARFGGSDAISPRVRAFLADTLVEQNRNVEQDRQRNAAAANDRFMQASQGTFAGELIRAIESLAGAIRQGGSGYPQHGA